MSATLLRTAVLLTLSLPAIATEGRGQSIGTVRIRRYATDSVIAQGHLMGRVGQTLVIETSGRRAGYPISPDYVAERYGKKGHPVRGALVGFVAGLIVAVAVTPDETPGLCLSDCPRYSHQGEAQGSAGAMAALLLGPAVGALIGSQIKTGRGWSGLDPYGLPDSGPALAVEVSPARVGLGLKLRW